MARKKKEKDTLAQDILRQLRAHKGPVTLSLEELANKHNVSPNTVRLAFDEARKRTKRGTLIAAETVPSAYKDDVLQPHRKNGHTISTDPFFYSPIKFAGTADSHIASNFHLGDAKAKTGPLWDLYRTCEREGIPAVFHGGNYIDGHCNFNRFETRAQGVTAQVEMFLNEYPYVKGVRTAFISGDDHEGWWWKREGLDIAEYVALKAAAGGRDDMDFLGYLEADILIIPKVGFRYNKYLADPNEKKELLEITDRKRRPMPAGAQGTPETSDLQEYAVMKLAHGGGGTGYAKSYQPQKIVSGLESGEKPQILLIGHYHKGSYDWLRNIHTVQLGTTEEQSTFMRKKVIPADVGYYFFNANQAPTGEINRFGKRFVPYVTRGPVFGLRDFTMNDGR